MKGFSLNHLIREKRKVSYLILLGVWGQVALYAVLHDQYIVRIAPQHFTEYHEPLAGVRDPERLALVYALGASVGPGLALGMACLFAGRGGTAGKVPVRIILSGTTAVIVATELISAATGYYVYRTGKAVFPDFLYPDFSKAMLVTQTIQLSSYLLSAAFSALLVLFIILVRRRKCDPDFLLP